MFNKNDKVKLIENTTAGEGHLLTTELTFEVESSYIATGNVPYTRIWCVDHEMGLISIPTHKLVKA